MYHSAHIDLFLRHPNCVRERRPLERRESVAKILLLNIIQTWGRDIIP